MVNLANGFMEAGVTTHFIVNRQNGAYFERLTPNVTQVMLAANHDRGLIDELTAYLHRERPDIVMSGKVRDDRIALAAKDRLGNAKIRFFLRVGTPLFARADLKFTNPLSRWFFRHRMKQLFARCDGIIAVSQGVAANLSTNLGLSPERIAITPNPVITPNLADLARQPVEHPWMNECGVPVILGIGRLGQAKDFSTLIRAFALLRRERPCRLMILGKGRQKERLEVLGRRLGVAEDMDLMGFVPDPFAYLACARLFVLSSRWEGFSNVIAEALATGTPVVSTDCPSGPLEILQDGRYGPLVPVGDVEALAEAMDRTLENPPPAEFLREAVEDYTVANSSRAYLNAFGLRQP